MRVHTQTHRLLSPVHRQTQAGLSAWHIADQLYTLTAWLDGALKRWPVITGSDMVSDLREKLTWLKEKETVKQKWSVGKKGNRRLQTAVPLLSCWLFPAKPQPQCGTFLFPILSGIHHFETGLSAILQIGGVSKQKQKRGRRTQADTSKKPEKFSTFTKSQNKAFNHWWKFFPHALKRKKSWHGWKLLKWGITDWGWQRNRYLNFL